MKTILSDMGSFGILRRIQRATHAKSSYHTNVICNVFAPDLPRDSSDFLAPLTCLPCRLIKAGQMGDLPTDICETSLLKAVRFATALAS